MRRDILCGLGFSEAELLEIRDSELQQLKDGAATTGMMLHGGSGVGHAQQWQVINGMTPDQVMEAVKFALYQLYVSDPVTYAKYAACKPTSRHRLIRYVGHI